VGITSPLECRFAFALGVRQHRALLAEVVAAGHDALLVSPDCPGTGPLRALTFDLAPSATAAIGAALATPAQAPLS
jgi:hypothetical protein